MVSIWGLLLFETCVGISFACGGGLRSVVKRGFTGNDTNIFRIPLNILVVIGTRLDSFASTRQKFLVCVSWLAVALILQIQFVNYNEVKSGGNQKNKKSKKTSTKKVRSSSSSNAGKSAKKKPNSSSKRKVKRRASSRKKKN